LRYNQRSPQQVKNNQWNQGQNNNNQWGQNNNWKSNNNQVHSTPEPMEIDESIQYQNRPNNNFERGSSNRQNYMNAVIWKL